MAYRQLVILTAESDYLKRLGEISPAAGQGMSQPEIDSATRSAQDQIMIEMANIGFDITGWVDQSTTPYTVIEIIKLFASSRIWHRMLSQYAKDIDFGSTYGSTLYNAANRAINDVMKARALINPSTGAVIRATEGQEGKGIPKFQSTRLGIKPQSQLIKNSDLDCFIAEHAPDIGAETQGNPFLIL